MKFSRSILVIALVAACLSLSFIEAKRKSQNSKSKTKKSCSDSEISVTFSRESEKLPEVEGCLDKSSGQLNIKGVSGILNKLGEKIFDPLIRGLISATVSNVSLGTISHEKVNQELINNSKKNKTFDLKKVICDGYSKYKSGAFHDSIFVNSSDNKKEAMEIMADMGSGSALKKFYTELKCDNKIKPFSKKAKSGRRY